MPRFVALPPDQVHVSAKARAFEAMVEVYARELRDMEAGVADLDPGEVYSTVVRALREAAHRLGRRIRVIPDPDKRRRRFRFKCYPFVVVTSAPELPGFGEAASA